MGELPSYTQVQAQVQAQAQVQDVPDSAKSAAPFAFFPAFVAQKRERLVIKSSFTSTGYTYTITIDGRPIFTSGNKGQGLFSYHKPFYGTSGTHAFAIKEERRWFREIYNALASSETGPRLFECEFHSGDKCTGRFVNFATCQLEHFLLKRNYLENVATITNQATSQRVAEIKQWSMFNREHSAVVAQGIDMALVVVLWVIMRDREIRRSF